MKKLISILGITTIASSIMPGVVGNSPYQTNNIIQYQVLKMKNFVSDNTGSKKKVEVWHRVDTSSKFVSLVRLIITLFLRNATIFSKKIKYL